MTRQTAGTTELIDVVAGVMRDGRGRVLLAQRPEGKHLAGAWEFPGGKREPSETDRQALVRELSEELGIVVREARPWLSLTHRYPEISVRLKLYTVEEWHGQPRGLEGQPLQWATVAQMHDLPMPAADRPIVRAFGLDDRYAITPDPQDAGGVGGALDWARGALARGIRLFQLRARSLDEKALGELAREFASMMTEAGARWLLDGPPDLAVETRADGLHLDAARLARLSSRPLSGDYLVAASCHDTTELARAGSLALDFVTVSPVRPLARHSASGGLGWTGFEKLCRVSPLPVYALGGVSPDDLRHSRESGGFGVAGSCAFGGQ